MSRDISFFISVWLKFFFLLTPFFTLSMFLSITKDMDTAKKRITAIRTTCAVIAVCLFLYFFGNFLFSVFEITLDAFRIGAGGILFLSAVSLVKGNDTISAEDRDGDISVVPMAIPFTVGPGTTGALLVMGAEIHNPVQQIIGCSALCAAVLSVGVFLYASTVMERLIGKRGIKIFSKLTGLILSALAAQLIFTGIKNFFAQGQPPL